MLLDFEDSVGGTEVQILERAADVEPVLGVKKRAADARHDEQDNDRIGVASTADAAELGNEIALAGRYGHSLGNTQGLVGDGPQERHRQQPMDNQQSNNHGGRPLPRTHCNLAFDSPTGKSFQRGAKVWSGKAEPDGTRITMKSCLAARWHWLQASVSSSNPLPKAAASCLVIAWSTLASLGLSSPSTIFPIGKSCQTPWYVVTSSKVSRSSFAS